MKLSRTWKATILAIAAVLIIGWVVRGSEAFQGCVKESKHYSSYDTSDKEFGIVDRAFARVRLSIACTGIVADKNNGAITALAGVAVALFTFTLWLVTWDMVKIASRQREDILRSIVAAERSAEASLKQADIAAQTAVISRLTLEYTVRPVVEVTGFDYSWSAPGGQLTHWHFIPLLSNAGPVGTVNGITNSNWTFTINPLDADFDYPEITRKESDLGHPQRSPIGANKGITGVRAVVPIESVVEAYARRGHIFFWGWIEYDDGLPGTLRHRTEFAVEVVVKIDPRAPVFAPGAPPPAARFSIRNLPVHNGTDQECYRQPGHPRPSWLAHAGPRQDLPPDHPENGLVAGAT